jgi:hypothetical protein
MQLLSALLEMIDKSQSTCDTERLRAHYNIGNYKQYIHADLCDLFSSNTEKYYSSYNIWNSYILNALRDNAKYCFYGQNGNYGYDLHSSEIDAINKIDTLHDDFVQIIDTYCNIMENNISNTYDGYTDNMNTFIKNSPDVHLINPT